MDLKKVSILILALIVEIVFLSQDLKYSQKDGINDSDISIEFRNSQSYFITKDGINKKLIAKKIQQRSNEKLFFKPKAVFFDGDFTKVVTSDFAKYIDRTSVLQLEKNVKVMYRNGILTTSKLLYDSKKEVVFDSDKFKLVTSEFTALGNHLYFDVKNNIIKAKDIKYTFKE